MSDKKEKDIDEIVDSVTKNTKSESDRLELDKIKSLNLLKFIDAQIQRAVAKDDLKSEVTRKINKRVMSSDPDEEMTNVELIKLLEILNRSENDFSSNVMNSITELYRIKQEEESNKRNNSGNDKITKEDIKELRELSSIFKKLKVSEFSEDEDDND